VIVPLVKIQTNATTPRGRIDAGDKVMRRAIAYAQKIPPAVSGSGGHPQTMEAARCMVYGFDLGVEDGLRVLLDHYNPRCEPPWTESELRHKCEDANTKPFEKPRGWLLDNPGTNGHSAKFGNGGPAKTELSAEQAEAIEEHGDAWEPPDDQLADRPEFGGQKASPVIEPRLVRLADVVAQRTEWIWYRRIARGTINLIDGDPGLGKSLVTLDITARITRGWDMPPDFRAGNGTPSNVLLIGSEDDLARVVKPRLSELGADMERVFSLTEVLVGDEEFPIELPTHLPIIEQVVRDNGISLVVIDPFLSSVAGEYDSHKDADMRRLQAKVKKSAERTQAAFLEIRHLNKLVNVENAIYRGGGSIGIIGAARSALMVAKHPEDEDKRILARVKGNLSVDPEALSYSIESDGEEGWPTIKWHGTVDISADQTLDRKRKKDDQRRTAKDKSDDARVLNALDKAAGEDGAATYKAVRIAAGMGVDLVTRTVGRLIEDNLIEEVEMTVKSGRGREQEVTGIQRKRIGGLADG
jgi:hypothetical protein